MFILRLYKIWRPRTTSGESLGCCIDHFQSRWRCGRVDIAQSQMGGPVHLWRLPAFRRMVVDKHTRLPGAIYEAYSSVIAFRRLVKENISRNTTYCVSLSMSMTVRRKSSKVGLILATFDSKPQVFIVTTLQ